MSKIIVTKHGSSVVEKSGRIGIDQTRIDFFAYQHFLLRSEGWGTVEVSSGAVVAGKEQVHNLGRKIEAYDNRALAKLGTSKQIRHWEIACNALGIAVGQVLATHKEIDDTSEGKQIIEGIHSDVRQDTLIVLNENNAAADDEIKEYEKDVRSRLVGEVSAGADNDWMAAHFAISLGAKALLLLTNTVGFYREDKLVKKVKVGDIADLLEHCNGQSSSGTGGMHSKLLAAGRAAAAGVHVMIGSAFTDARRVLNGEGTQVLQ